MTQLIYSCGDRVFNINLPDHAQSHEWRNGQPGSDVLNVYPRMFTLLRTTATPDSVLVNVSPFYYIRDGSYYVFGSSTYNLTPHIPTTPNYSRLVLLGLDTATNLLTAYEGAESFESALTPPALPTGIATTFIPSALIKLKYGAIALTELDITDARPFLSLPVTSTVAGGNVWPKPGKVNIGDTEYSTLALALAAMVADDNVMIGEGVYTVNNGQINTEGELTGSGRNATFLRQISNTTNILDVNVAGDYAISDLCIDATDTSVVGIHADHSSLVLQVTNVNIFLDSGSAPGLPDPQVDCLKVPGGSTQVKLFNCWFKATSSGNEAYVLDIQGGTTIVNSSCILDGQIFSAPLTTVVLEGCIWLNGNPGVNIGGGTVTGHYYDENGHHHTLDTSGESGGVWLHKSSGLRIKYATLAAAITAAADGDKIKLFPGTYTITGSSLALNKAIEVEGDGLEYTFITAAISASPTIDITDNATLRNLTVTNTAGGSDAGPIAVGGVNVVLDNVVATKASGAPTTGYGIWMYDAGSLVLKNRCVVSCTSGTSKYGIKNDLASTTITIEAGCVVGGDTADVYGTQAGSVLNLNGCTLTNAIANFSGTVRGVALDQYGRRLRRKPAGIFNARMTLTTATPVTTSDVTAATTIYLTPYKGGEIEVFNGYMWIEAPFTELSLSLASFTAGKNSDLWVYDNAGTLALERTEWTNDTTRATALSVQDGRYVKSGTVTRLYCGTFRTTGTTGQTEDSLVRRYVWNYYNRVLRGLRVLNNTGHTYNSTTWRAFNNDQANSDVEVVVGVAEDYATVGLFVRLSRGATTDALPMISFGVNATNTPASNVTPCIVNGVIDFFAGGSDQRVPLSAGYSYICGIEKALVTGATAATFSQVDLTVALNM